jgi:hypothetical protein
MYDDRRCDLLTPQPAHTLLIFGEFDGIARRLQCTSNSRAERNLYNQNAHLTLKANLAVVPPGN